MWRIIRWGINSQNCNGLVLGATQRNATKPTNQLASQPTNLSAYSNSISHANHTQNTYHTM